MNYQHKDLIDLFNKHIGSLKWDKHPQGLYGPIAYILEEGGKRFRPVLTLAAASVWTQNLTKALDAATGIEVFHNFTLLHDDIMDDADLRRGRPSVHVKYNVNTGILSGDAMLILAMQFIEKSCDNTNRQDIMDSFLQTSLEVCEGQQMDVDFENMDCPAQSDYIEMIRKKTAILPAVALKIGALIGGGGQTNSEALYSFGENLGLAFQVQDDILDTYGDQTYVGKTIGGDILQNKKTILYILAYNNASFEDQENLKKLYSQKLPDSDKIDKVKSIFGKYEVLAKADLLKQKLHDRAIDGLSSLSVADEKKTSFESMAQFLLNRKY